MLLVRFWCMSSDFRGFWQRHNRRSTNLSFIHNSESNVSLAQTLTQLVSSWAHAKLKLCLSPSSYFVPRDLCHYTFPFVNQFSSLSISCLATSNMPSAVIFTQSSSYFTWLNSALRVRSLLFSLLLFIFHRECQKFIFFDSCFWPFFFLCYSWRVPSKWWKRYISMVNRLNLSIGNYWSAIVSTTQSWTLRGKSSNQRELIRDVRLVTGTT